MSDSSQLNDRIEGSRNARIAQEFLTNSAVFPLFDAIRTLSIYGPAFYFTELPHYLLMVAALIQAWFLGHRTDLSLMQRVLGNLLAPVLYSLSDILLDGIADFTDRPYHWMYWGFSLVMAAFYAVEGLWPQRWKVVIFLKNIWRVLLFPVMYASTELAQVPAFQFWEQLWNYWGRSKAHLFILLAALLLGLLLSLREVQTEAYLKLLKKLAHHLYRVSQWSFSDDLLEKSVEDTRVLGQKRVERTILFADIRGFTAWSEGRAPEAVVALLNRFYQEAEDVLCAQGGMKPHYIGDAVMSWFVSPEQAVRAAVELRVRVQRILHKEGLGAGFGIHSGPVIEGLLGSSGTRNYDVIGDTVNTASRIMTAAGAGEILVSLQSVGDLRGLGKPRALRKIRAKGKRDLLEVWVM